MLGASHDTVEQRSNILNVVRWGFLVAQAGGQTWDLLVFVYFSLSISSAFDHSANAPPKVVRYLARTTQQQASIVAKRSKAPQKLS